MNILGIETSCDDTCAAIVSVTGGKNPRFQIRSNVRSSQVRIHKKYGGVVPNLAARAHLENIHPVIRLALKEANVPLSQVKRHINLITVTTHPGLIPCLLIGTHVAKTLAWGWKKPILGVNHLEGHVYAILAENPPSRVFKTPPSFLFPALCLVVSGGHTQLILMKGYGKFTLLGETRDDAAGEAFDKVAKLLGLPFPGGPPLATRASRGNPHAFEFPRPMIHSSDYDFSFSGLKTAIVYLVKERFEKKGTLNISERDRNNICASFQQAVIDVLISKTMRAAKRNKVQTIILGGGVAANTELKIQLGEILKKELPRVMYLAPPASLAVDNAAMIAIAGYFRYKEGKAQNWKQVHARAEL